MIIYNVTIKTEPEIAGEWINWMQEEHIPDLLRTGLFTGYRLCRLLEQDEQDGITYTVQYFCENMDAYQTYIRDHAQEMREKGLARFGGRFIAFRTVMEVIG
jgi:hypothetical protein